jgi:hypothetical protein
MNLNRHRRVTCGRVRLIEQSLIPDDATRRVVTKWLQGYGKGGQKRDEKAVVPQARTKECGRKDITETSTD